ncbi:MAG: SDR family NAD(P)-dependent oxidoreductase [Pseudolabrys sp.]|nr:SDR family NAD(P)-dependent oxidoreductase [Pseudolabrys sp.]MDP2293992.1 SDR family NAD(P)-dependent oxidoreductase [Pseudolabrys sp.]
MGALDNRHVLITGGGTGIGAAIARALSKEGAKLSLAGRRQAPLDAMAAELPRTKAIIADITKDADCAAMVQAANAAHGPIDIVIANAGAASSAPVSKIDLKHWQQAIDVNLTGAFLTVSAALADVTRAAGGRVIFIASTAGLKGYPYVAAYVAAKHGVVGLMRALSIELAGKGVTVNAVCPGYTDTALLDAAADKISAKTGRSAGDARVALAKDNAHGRLITPEEVADAVLWLCSPGASSINGQAIAVTGGPL